MGLGLDMRLTLEARLCRNSALRAAVRVCTSEERCAARLRAFLLIRLPMPSHSSPSAASLPPAAYSRARFALAASLAACLGEGWGWGWGWGWG